MASAGYPGKYKTGLPITGLNNLDKDILVFHAGTNIGSEPEQVLTDGGRVLTVVSTGKTIAEARERSTSIFPEFTSMAATTVETLLK
jgi:phosphoribosylamine--glycine ligase